MVIAPSIEPQSNACIQLGTWYFPVFSILRSAASNCGAVISPMGWEPISGLRNARSCHRAFDNVRGASLEVRLGNLGDGMACGALGLAFLEHRINAVIDHGAVVLAASPSFSDRYRRVTSKCRDLFHAVEVEAVLPGSLAARSNEQP